MPQQAVKKKRPSRAKLYKAWEKADTLYDIWRIALRDLKVCERMRNVEIDMRVWLRRNGKCTVCAAGAVIHQRWPYENIPHIVRKLRLTATHDDEAKKLAIINALRHGFIEQAAHTLYCLDAGYNKYPTITTDPYYVTPYATDKRLFWRDARALLKHLKEKGL